MKAFTVEVAGSRRLTMLLVAVHAGAAALPWCSNLPAPLALCVSTIVGIGSWFHWHTHVARRGKRALRGLRFGGANRWWVRTGDGTEVPADIGPNPFVTPWLVVLTWRQTGARFRVGGLIPADAVEPDSFRRLRRQLISRQHGAVV